jgi:carbamoyltransferase
MRILGMKFSHDGGVAYIRDGKLEGAVEIEKLDNNPRYSKMTTKEQFIKAVNAIGMFSHGTTVVDGWKGGQVASPYGTLKVGPYHDHDGVAGHLLFGIWQEAEFAASGVYHSYPHMAGHVIGSYVCSPYAAERRAVAVISMDGGQNPRLHIVDPNAPQPVRFVGALHQLYGIVYGIQRYYFGPYADPEVRDMLNVPGRDMVSIAKHGPYFGGYEAPGKIMAYIAHGTINHRLLKFINHLYANLETEIINQRGEDRHGYHQNGIMEHRMMRAIRLHSQNSDLTDADVLATIHEFLERLLVLRAELMVPAGMPVIFTGGSALNIKWNTALRDRFKEVWVPPFPNDSGSALGAAACEMVVTYDHWHLDWSVFCGPEIVHDPEVIMDRGPYEVSPWRREICDPQMLAEMFAGDETNDAETLVVVFLHGNAELGPRALGHRSLLARATSNDSRDRLNKLKGREDWRPVAPICLEEYAQEFFRPGTPDPYMLFDHQCTPNALRVPAIIHLDGTARLQTVGMDGDLFIRETLKRYHALTGIPMLCNTSANRNGSGFFPSLSSAMAWADEVGVKHIFCNGYLYSKE